MPSSDKSSFVGTLCLTIPFENGSGLILYGDQQFDWQGKNVNVYGVKLHSKDPNEFVGKHLRITGTLLPPKEGFDATWPVIDAIEVEIVPYVGWNEMYLESDALSLALAITPPEFSWKALPKGPSIRAVLTNKSAAPRDFQFRDGGRICFKVTQINALPVLACKDTWVFPEVVSDLLGSITLGPSQTLEVEVGLPQKAAPVGGTYALGAQLCGYKQYRTQTQFLIRT